MVKINAKKAVSLAQDYLKELSEISNSRLEEIEFDEKESYWFVTLSFQADTLTEGRLFRILKIDSELGEVKSMKIR